MSSCTRENFLLLYEDGKRRIAAIDNNSNRPALLIPDEFQSTIKTANLDASKGETFWGVLKRVWPDAPADAEAVCRSVTRALRNKRSANTSSEKSKQRRLQEQQLLLDCKTINAELEKTVQTTNLFFTLARRASDAGRNRRTSACTGLEAVRILSGERISGCVRPYAGTLYVCNNKSIREVGDMVATRTSDFDQLADCETGVVYIDEHNCTQMLPKKF